MSNNRGGARPNAGRKSLGKVSISSRISEQAKERLSQLAINKGMSISDMLDLIINSYQVR